MKKRITSLCIAIGLCMMIGIVVSGCGSSASGNMSPTETVTVFLDAFKAQDEKTMDQVYAGDGNDFLSAYEDREDESETDAAIKDALMSKWYDFDYEVISEEIAEDESTADVNVNFTTYDMSQVFNNFYEEFMTQALEQYSGESNNVSEEDYNAMALKILQEQVDAVTEKDYQAEAMITLTKTDGKWIIDDLNNNDAFLNAITGGMMNVLQDVVDSMGVDE